MFYEFQIFEISFFEIFEKAGTENPDDSSDEILTILDTISISIQKMKLEIGDMGQISFKHLKRLFWIFETKKPRNQETLTPRDQETNIPWNQNEKPRNQ